MPEIIIPGLREVAKAPSEKQHSELKKLREEHKVQVWSSMGTEEECEASWREFLLKDTPDWEIVGG